MDAFGRPFRFWGINTLMSIFDDFRENLTSRGISPRTAESQKWFLNKVRQIGDDQTINREKMMRQSPLKATFAPIPGKMYLFHYPNPKTEKTLPYYDEFPLIILVDVQQKGMTGINLHYLPVEIRQRFFYGGLLNTVNTEDFNDGTYMKLSYEFLKGTASLKAFRPCFKRYLTKQIRGRIVNVPAPEWETAIHLPLALFRKAEEATVHRESEKIIGRF